MFTKILLFFVVIWTLAETRSYGILSQLDGKIVGGTAANIEDFPYQLSMRYKGKHGCGASIISAKWALTASHCVEGVSVFDITLVSGTSFRVSGGTKHPAVKIIMHPKYNPTTTDFDYALIEVDISFPLGTAGVATVKLAMDEPVAGITGNVTGWGTLHSGATSLPDHLQKVQIPIVSRATCKKDYQGSEITERMICAGLETGGKDACQGDSGGPLVSNGNQIGIVSWGYGCAMPNKPGIYSNVAYAYNWIKSETGLQ